MKNEILTRKTWYIFDDCTGNQTVVFIRTRREREQAAQFIAALTKAREQGSDSRFYEVYARTAYRIMRRGCHVQPFRTFSTFLRQICHIWHIDLGV